MAKKVVYYFCISKDRPGTVSRLVWQVLEQKGIFEKTELMFDNHEVMSYHNQAGDIFYFVPTDRPICWNYPKYLPEMNEKFGDCDFAGMVTWHEGASAPLKVLTVHSIGDVNSGVYGPAKPNYMRNILLAMEKNRLALGLTDFQVVTEATHWSGIAISGTDPKLILEYPVPIVDIEVGSEKESWENETACEALANAILHVFADDERKVHNILGIGGIHFDPNFAEAIFTQWDNDAFGVSHIIANQWLVDGEYEGEDGLEFASRAIEAIDGGVELIVFHDGLKACYKNLARVLAAKYNVPALRHQRIRNPQELEWK